MTSTPVSAASRDSLAARLREILSYRELLLNLTLRELRTRYRRSTLGWAWSLLNPIATMLIFSVVFRVILRIEVPPGERSGLQNFPLFLLSGLIFWNFFAGSINSAMGLMTGNAGLISKVYFPREILVIATVGSALVTLLVELVALSAALMIVGNFVLPWLPIVLFFVLVQAAFVTGIALACSVGNVYFRDLEYLVGILLQLLFYAAPIVYPALVIPPTVDVAGLTIPFAFLYNINPLVRFVQVYRDALYDLTFPPLADTVFLVVVSAVTLWIGWRIFSRFSPRLAEEL